MPVSRTFSQADNSFMKNDVISPEFDENGRRVDAGLTIIQWQKGTPITVYPPELAMAPPVWNKNK
jgi:hypothetical protein